MAARTRGWRTLGPAIPLGLAALLASSGARADDEEELAALLDEHVVSGASKTEEQAKDAPATTSVLTGEDMFRYGIRSLNEAIDYLGMGMITQNPLHSVEVGGRGVLLTSDFGNHVLLVVDGHVFNEPWDGTAYFEQGAGVPIEMIDHIELILGPGSVLYGGNAMIGVVNIVTKRASNYSGVHLIAGGSASPQQGSHGNITSWAPANVGGMYRLGVGLGQKLTLWGHDVEVVGQAELYRQDGPSFLWGKQTVTNDDGSPASYGPRVPIGEWGGRILHQYRTSVPTVYLRAYTEDVSVMFRAESYRRTTPTQGFDQQETDFDQPRSFERDRFLSLDVEYKKRLGERFRLSARAFADAYDYNQDTYSSEPSTCAAPVTGPCRFNAQGRSRWLGSEIQGTYDWFGTGRYETLVGLRGIVRDIGGETDAIEANTGRVAEVDGKRDVTEFAGAAYVQQRVTPVNFLHLNAGGRFDHDPRGGNRFSPRASAAFDVWQGGVLKVIYAEAFRAPNFFEYFFASPFQVPNFDLRSETVRSVESTIEQRVGRHKVLFGVYRSWWSDMISLQGYQGSTDISQYVNSGSIDNLGYNGRIEGSLGNFRYGGSVTGAYTRRNTPDGKETLPVAPQLFGNLRASYAFPGFWPTVAVATTFVGSRPADRALDGNFNPIPYAPASADIRLTLSQKVKWVPGLSYRLGGSWTAGNYAPYVAGPTTGYDITDPGRSSAQLTPTVKLSIFGTLHYDFSL